MDIDPPPDIKAVTLMIADYARRNNMTPQQLIDLFNDGLQWQALQKFGPPK